MWKLCFSFPFLYHTNSLLLFHTQLTKVRAEEKIKTHLIWCPFSTKKILLLPSSIYQSSKISFNLLLFQSQYVLYIISGFMSNKQSVTDCIGCWSSKNWSDLYVTCEVWNTSKNDRCWWWWKRFCFLKTRYYKIHVIFT